MFRVKVKGSCIDVCDLICYFFMCVVDERSWGYDGGFDCWGVLILVFVF